MQKGLIVIKWLFILAPYFGYSQDKLFGVYSPLMFGQEYYKNYEFKNGVFEYRYGASLGDDEYGKGHYFLKNDSLVLNYNLTELKVNGYHKFKRYKNSADSIEIKLNIYETYKNPLSRVNVLNMKSRYVVGVNDKGVAHLKFKKGIGVVKIDVTEVDYIGYSFFIDTKYNYEIDIFLRKLPNTVLIKNEIINYKIIEFKEDFLLLENKDKEIIKWKKQVKY